MAELTLTERNTLAESPLFRGRIQQGLFKKATYYHISVTPANLKQHKQVEFAKRWLIGGANATDVYANTRHWLSNYNESTPELETNNALPEYNQPTDNAILNTQALDFVYDLLAGVVDGDDVLPIP